LENFAKNCFSEKKIFVNFLMQDFYTFLKSAQNSASFDTLCGQFRRNCFLKLWKGTAMFFWKLKAQIRFLKTLFYKLVLEFQGQTEITWSKVIYENHWTLVLYRTCLLLLPAQNCCWSSWDCLLNTEKQHILYSKVFQRKKKKQVETIYVHTVRV
jgi:hypothetical protein